MTPEEEISRTSSGAEAGGSGGPPAAASLRLRSPPRRVLLPLSPSSLASALLRPRDESAQIKPDGLKTQVRWTFAHTL